MDWEKTPLLHGQRVVEKTRIMFKRDRVLTEHPAAPDTHAKERSGFSDTQADWKFVEGPVSPITQ